MIESPFFMPINLETESLETFKAELLQLGIEQLTVTSRNSEKISDPQTKVVVCLSGFTETGEDTFGLIADMLAENPNIVVLLFSAPGSSESTFTPEALDNNQAFDAQKYSQLVEAYLEKLDIKPELILGHSFGAVAATQIDAPNKVLLAPAFKITDGFQMIISQLIKKKEKGEELDDRYTTLLTAILGILPTHFVKNINTIPASAIRKVLAGLLLEQPFTLNQNEKITGFYSKGIKRQEKRMDRIREVSVGEEKVIDVSAIPPQIEVVTLDEGGHNAHLNPENKIIICKKIIEMLQIPND